MCRWQVAVQLKLQRPHRDERCWHNVGRPFSNLNESLHPPRRLHAYDRAYGCGARYICTQRKQRGERYCFNGYDPNMIAQLRNHSQLVVPAALTHRLATTQQRVPFPLRDEHEQIYSK